MIESMRIAVTGGIAEGKSTALGYLRELGFLTASADDVAREVFELPIIQRGLSKISGLPTPIDRAMLRELIAGDPGMRRRVNGLMHPEIVARLDASSATFVEIPLLIETCRYLQFDQVWVVTCGREEQVRRLLERYGDRVQVDAMLSAQIDTRAKVPFADCVLRTNVSTETVRELVSEASAFIFRL